eukprot:TRINITY_DN14617_c0_g1_i1.p2 TRINITY_DN14617_c0_g1~~TRINITY_DN14617_c0_g1_i1.p2  ORF type:complete len:80 (+),score=10.09 TRINITY_DN14617_c0_g1_i1:173-412(+)
MVRLDRPSVDLPPAFIPAIATPDEDKSEEDNHPLEVDLRRISTSCGNKWVKRSGKMEKKSNSQQKTEYPSVLSISEGYE